MSPDTRWRLAAAALFTVFLIPVGQSWLGGLTHVLSCEQAVETPFQILLVGGKPVITSASELRPGGGDTACGGVRVDISAAATGEGKVTVRLALENGGAHEWRGTIELRLAGVRIPFDIGRVAAGSTGATEVEVRVPEGATQIDGSLLVGP